MDLIVTGARLGGIQAWPFLNLAGPFFSGILDVLNESGVFYDFT